MNRMNRKKKLENDKLDLQQEEAEINLRYQNLSNFTYKSPNVNNVEKYNMTMPLLNENNNLENTDKNFNSYSGKKIIIWIIDEGMGIKWKMEVITIIKIMKNLAKKNI